MDPFPSHVLFKHTAKNSLGDLYGRTQEIRFFSDEFMPRRAVMEAMA
jgi:hypothetical protein